MRQQDFDVMIVEKPPRVWPDYLMGQADNPVRVIVIDDDPHMRKVISQELMGDSRTVVGCRRSGSPSVAFE